MTRDYGRGTYLTMSDDMWRNYTGGAALCSDGQVRKLARISTGADTFFSIPAAVVVKGVTVAGYVTIETEEGFSTESATDIAVVKFIATVYNKNHALLPGGAWKKPIAV